ncbi:GNAT family N-acetyltransferase [Bacillus salacetis]|uniref:GNAT family N-acetyltransferase n=1 Tax=Bacillus salacetis TaxID=2315464 RepID=A0A3A1R083_9BACI|nr:GNAT family N-acetyltransferase [Bacillus salacetis]RIW35103.1 GNAT family N-acetyltransferase [Bacillus salacetis]
MTIRELTAADAEEYWNLRLEALQKNGEAFAVTYKESLARSNPIAGVRNNLASENSVTIGAFIEGHLSANVTLLYNQHEKMRHKATIAAMYVSPSFRKAGIGRQLLEAAETTAKKNGIELLQLTVVTTNKSAITLYRDFGFESFGIEKKAMKQNGNYIDEVWMNKMI